MQEMSGFKIMSAADLSGEIIPDAENLHSGFQTYFSLHLPNQLTMKILCFHFLTGN